MKYEVRTEAQEIVGIDEHGKGIFESIGYNVETRRTSEKDAELDVDLLKMLGKKAWIVEVT